MTISQTGFQPEKSELLNFNGCISNIGLKQIEFMNLHGFISNTELEHGPISNIVFNCHIQRRRRRRTTKRRRRREDAGRRKEAEEAEPEAGQHAAEPEAAKSLCLPQNLRIEVKPLRSPALDHQNTRFPLCLPRKVTTKSEKMHGTPAPQRERSQGKHLRQPERFCVPAQWKYTLKILR